MDDHKKVLKEESTPADGYMETGIADANAQLALDFCGFEKCRPGHSFGPMARSIYIVHVVMSGRGILRCGDSTYSLKEKSSFVLLPGVETYYEADREDPWYYCWAAFHGTRAGEVVKKIGFSKKHPVIAVSDGAELEKTIQRMMKYPEISTHDYLMRTGLLHLFLAQLMEESSSELSAGRGADLYSLSYADYAARYIRIHFREKLRISRIAEHIGISRSYLVKLFRESTGMTPQEYLIRMRMEYALHGLAHTGDSIRDIASSCGYDDPLAFSKAFKAYYGMSPTKCRSLFREKKIREDQIDPYARGKK